MDVEESSDDSDSESDEKGILHESFFLFMDLMKLSLKCHLLAATLFSHSDGEFGPAGYMRSHLNSVY